MATLKDALRDGQQAKLDELKKKADARQIEKIMNQSATGRISASGKKIKQNHV